MKSDLNRQIGTGLARLAQGMRGLLWHEARSAGLSPNQAQVLLSLLAAADPMTVGSLAEQFGTSAPTISEGLTVLERKGLVARTHGINDRRQVLITLTAAGEEMARRLVGWNGLLDQAVLDLPESDRNVFYRSLLSLVATLEQHGAVCARVCPACEFFCPEPGEGRTYHCSLSDLILEDEDLRVDCPGFQIRVG